MPFLNIDDQIVAYRDLGPRHAPAILLAHPLGMTQAVWDELAPELDGAYRLISWDLPGHGASGPARQPVTAEDLAGTALAILNSLGIQKAHFVGTSIGGVVGMQLLLLAPERLHRVILTNTGARIGTPQAWQQRAQDVRQQGLTAMSQQLVSGWFAPAFQQQHPEALTGWQVQLDRCDDESYARLCELLASTDLRDYLAGQELPVHLLAGAVDASTPPQTLSALADEFDQADLHTLADVGHVPSVEAPATLAAYLRAKIETIPEDQPASFEAGLDVRRSVLGHEHVERSLQNATTLDRPFQDLITRMAWGQLWGNTDLARPQRSMITLGILAALGRDGELELHLETAKTIGLSEMQLRQVFMHVAIYAGVPAANHAFKLAREHGWGTSQD